MSMSTTTKVLIGAGFAVGAAGIAWAIYASSRKKGNGYSGATPPPDVADRIGTLQDAVWDGVRNPDFRELALAITGHGQRRVFTGKQQVVVDGAACAARDGRCEADAIGRWVAQNAAATSLLPAGADSPAALTCTLLSLNGITCQFRVARVNGQVAKVYPVAGMPKNTPDRWVSVDPTNQPYSLGGEVVGTSRSDYPG
jgi:hypothetical protein